MNVKSVECGGWLIWLAWQKAIEEERRWGDPKVKRDGKAKCGIDEEILIMIWSFNLYITCLFTINKVTISSKDPKIYLKWNNLFTFIFLYCLRWLFLFGMAAGEARGKQWKCRFLLIFHKSLSLQISQIAVYGVGLRISVQRHVRQWIVACVPRAAHTRDMAISLYNRFTLRNWMGLKRTFKRDTIQFNMPTLTICYPSISPLPRRIQLDAF